jgi:hypothetical protein
LYENVRKHYLLKEDDPTLADSMQNDENVEYLGKFQNKIKITPKYQSSAPVGRPGSKRTKTKHDHISHECVQIKAAQALLVPGGLIHHRITCQTRMPMRSAQ